MRQQQRSLLFLPVLAAACATGLNAGTAIADDLLLRVNASQLDYKTTATLAEIGLPAKLKVQASERLGAVIQRLCGRRDEQYLRLLQGRASDYPVISQPMTFDSAISGDHELELPFCLVVPAEPFSAKVAWQPHLSAKLAWQQHATSLPDSVFGPKFPTPTSGSGGIQDIFSTRDFDISLGGVGYEGWAGVPLRAGGDRLEALRTVLAALNAANPPPVATDARQPPPIVALGEQGIKVVSAPASSDDKCPERSMPEEKYPFDAMGFLRVLGLNQARGRPWFGETQIIVVDTGLSDEAARTIPNGLVHFGLTTDNERRQTLDYPDRSHGSYVVSAALGGAYFRRFSALLDQPVKVRPINIVEVKDGTLASRRLLKVLELGRYEKAVINLSISYGREIDGLKSVLDQRRNALFVAAAGNTPGPVTSEHPAALGGQYQNLIVVSSLTQDGEPEIKQSTWSGAHVELASYGCRIPVHEEGSETSIVHRSGTSLAAPLVSFAAAILNKYNIGSPAEVKTRLLASADYDPKLDGKVKRNLKLNVVRAVAIASDVVETSTKNDAPIYGKIVKGGSLLLLCGGDYSMGRGTKAEPGSGNRSLLSLDVFKERGVNRIFFLYQMGATGNLESHTCELDQQLADHEIVIEQHDGGGARVIRVADLRKLLFSLDFQ